MTLVVLGTVGVGAAALSAASIGTNLLWLKSPRRGQIVGLEGLEVVVRFAEGGRAEASTFRALLNGADVSAAFLAAENGAYGTLHGLLDGENSLRVEVFGRPLWGGNLYLERGREVRVFYRRPTHTDRG